MVKLPMSDYVCNYYREQGIEFSFRQQAHICWYYHNLLEDQLKSIRDILVVSDDEELNREIEERLEYEEKAYACFMTNNDSGCIYIVRPDDREDNDEEYFASAEKAIAYGIHNFEEGFKVEKSWLFDRNPKGLSETADADDRENVNELLAWYFYTPGGDIRYGGSNEYQASFEQEDSSRFENMFLNIKSPFGLGDIVMGSYFDYPQVVSTGHDCFEKLYERLKEKGLLMTLDAISNCIRTDYVGRDGKFYYDHTVPFDLWKIDSWDDEEYWNILQYLSNAIKQDVELFDINYFVYEYSRHHKGEEA